MPFRWLLEALFLSLNSKSFFKPTSPILCGYRILVSQRFPKVDPFFLLVDIP
jgi:hypothetical protein